MMDTTASIRLNSQERVDENECAEREVQETVADPRDTGVRHTHAHSHAHGQVHSHAHTHRHAHMRPLTLAGMDGPVRVGALRGNDDLKRHLSSLGFAAGGEVRVISELGGNLIVDVKGARIALDRKLAQKIMVE